MNVSLTVASEPACLIAEAWSGNPDLVQDLELALQPQRSIVDSVQSAVSWCAQTSASLVWRWMQRSVRPAAEAKPAVASLEQVDFIATSFESLQTLLQSVIGALYELQEKIRRLEEKVDRISTCSYHFRDRAETAGIRASGMPAAQELFVLSEHEGGEQLGPTEDNLLAFA